MALSPELIGALTGAGIGGLGLDIASGGKREGESSGERRKRFLGNLLQGGALGGLAGAAAGSSYSQGGAMADIVNKLKETFGGPNKPAPGILQKTVNTPALAVNEVRNVLSYPYAIGTTVAAAPALNLLRNFSSTTKANVKDFVDRANNADLSSHITKAERAMDNYNKQMAAKIRAQVLNKKMPTPKPPGPNVMQRFESELTDLGRTSGLFNSQSSRAVDALLNRIPPNRLNQVLAYLKSNGVNPEFLNAVNKRIAYKQSPMKAIGRHAGRGVGVGAAAYLADWLMRTRPTQNTPSLDEVGLNALNKLSQ